MKTTEEIEEFKSILEHQQLGPVAETLSVTALDCYSNAYNILCWVTSCGCPNEDHINEWIRMFKSTHKLHEETSITE